MALKASEPRPARYTGRHGDRYYYRGVRWLGPTNLIGAAPRTLIEVLGESHAWGLTTGARRRTATPQAESEATS